MALQQRQMQADAEFWIFLRQFHRFVKTGFIHHQAGGRQNAFAMRANDGFIDRMRKAKIVGIHDQAARRDVSDLAISGRS